MTFEKQLQHALDTVGDRLRDEFERQARAIVGELTAQMPVAPEGAATTGSTATDLGSSEGLLDAVRAIDRARSLSEILETLLACAAREAERAAILLIRGDRFYGWRFAGFGLSFEETERVDCDAGAAGVVGDAASTGAVARAANGDGNPPAFAELPAGRVGIALPIVMDGHVVAVLYADQGSSPESRIPNSAALEIMASHAARCLEVYTAFKAARVLMTWNRADVADAVQSAPPADAPADNDAAAERYARLLVSEIKLYHEAEVVEGRRERDLATRLGGEIARARVLYEQRVPAEARQGADHFHAELVRTLANGDASLLDLKT